MEYSTVELELVEGVQWAYSYWIFPKIVCEVKKAAFRTVFMLLMFRKTTQTCSHMPRITAHLHSKLAKRGCLRGGEGGRPPSFFSCDIVGSPVSLPLRLRVTNAVGAPVRPAWLCLPLPSLPALSPQGKPEFDVYHSHVSLYTFAAQIGKWTHRLWYSHTVRRMWSSGDDKGVFICTCQCGWISEACGWARHAFFLNVYFVYIQNRRILQDLGI